MLREMGSAMLQESQRCRQMLRLSSAPQTMHQSWWPNELVALASGMGTID
jgi:hypothetical protein